MMVQLMFMIEIKLNHPMMTAQNDKMFRLEIHRSSPYSSFARSTPSASMKGAKVAILLLEEISSPDNRAFFSFGNTSDCTDFQIIDLAFDKRSVLSLFVFHFMM